MRARAHQCRLRHISLGNALVYLRRSHDPGTQLKCTLDLDFMQLEFRFAAAELGLRFADYGVGATDRRFGRGQLRSQVGIIHARDDGALVDEITLFDGYSGEPSGKLRRDIDPLHLDAAVGFGQTDRDAR